MNRAFKYSWFYVAPIVGVLTYNAVLFLFGEHLTDSFAWLNSVVSIYTLLGFAIMYMPTDVRKIFISRYSLLLLIVLTILLSSVILKKDTAGNILYLIFCHFTTYYSLIYIETNNRISLAKTNIFSAVTLPLLAILWDYVNLSFLPLFIIPFIFANAHLFRKYSVGGFKTLAAFSHIPKLITGIAIQAPFFLLPLVEPKVATLAVGNEYLNFLWLWKIVNGGLVFLFTRFQYYVVFEEGGQMKHNTSYVYILIFLIFGILLLNEASILQTFVLVVLVSILLNLCSLYSRNYLRCKSYYVGSAVNLIVVSTILILFISDANITLLTRLGIDVVQLYIAVIAIFSLTPLLIMQLSNMVQTKDRIINS